MATITGTPGTAINASCSAPSAGDFVTGASIQTPLHSVENDLATIAHGTWTSDGVANLVGKTRLRAQESLSDANHNLDINSNKNRIIMRTAPAGNRILTLLKASASPAPVAGDWFEVTVLLGTSGFTVSLQREGAVGTYIAVIGDGIGTSPYASSNQTGTVLAEYDGTNWRFAAAGGVAFYGGDA